MPYLCNVKTRITIEGRPVIFLTKLADAAKTLKLTQYSQVVILSDENTRALCLPQLLKALPALAKATVLEIPAGEGYKTLTTCEKVWQQLFALQIDRSALLINLGGGVITDMGGFIASTYKRGIDFINIPTTLLAQVDATVGGKTGIDFGSIKNGIGTFSFAKQVFIYTPFLKTLPDEQLMSGYAEMLKHALITSPKDWADTIKINPLKNKKWDELIYRSLAIKQKIVQQDPYESGVRKTLNFGHTLGHALEGYSLKHGQPLLHGHAVALGMIGELWLSEQKTGFPHGDVQKIRNALLKLYQPYFNIDWNTNKLSRLISNDKKNKSGKTNFVLLSKIGKPVLDVSCEGDEIKAAVKHLENHV